MARPGLIPPAWPTRSSNAGKVILAVVAFMGLLFLGTWVGIVVLSTEKTPAPDPAAEQAAERERLAREQATQAEIERQKAQGDGQLKACPKGADQAKEQRPDARGALVALPREASGGAARGLHASE